MRRWLIITTVDVLARPNNREHQLVAHLADRFESVDVVFRRTCRRGDWASRFKDALIPRWSIERRGKIRYIAVNPLLNHYHGMVRDATGVSRANAKPVDRLAYKLAEPLGIAKDISTVSSLAAACLFCVPAGRDVVCTALGPWAAASARMLRRAGRIGSWIYEDRDYEPGFFESPLRGRWAEMMEIAGIRSASEVISIGARLAALRRQQTGREPILIPTGAKQNGVGRRASPPEPALVYVGNVARWAGLDRVATALVDVRRRVPGARLLIAGDGPREAIRDIRAAAAQAGVETAVEFLGPIPHADVAQLLADAAVGIATFEPTPLRVFAAPLKVFEYMAAGLPIIATDATEAADIVQRHRCGVSTPLDAAAIANAITHMLTNAERWGELSRNGVAASAHYDWSVLMEREWQVMRDVDAHSRGRE
jgi:glycosyltransferase involved in cell wall biosynthesis